MRRQPPNFSACALLVKVLLRVRVMVVVAVAMMHVQPWTTLFVKTANHPLQVELPTLGAGQRSTPLSLHSQLSITPQEYDAGARLDALLRQTEGASPESAVADAAATSRDKHRDAAVGDPMATIGALAGNLGITDEDRATAASDVRRASAISSDSEPKAEAASARSSFASVDSAPPASSDAPIASGGGSGSGGRGSDSSKDDEYTVKWRAKARAPESKADREAKAKERREQRRQLRANKAGNAVNKAPHQVAHGAKQQYKIDTSGGSGFKILAKATFEHITGINFGARKK